MKPDDLSPESRPPDNGQIWHPGELQLQASIGAVEQMERIGQRMIRDFMPDQHRQFFAQLPFIVLGSVDENNRPWVSMRTGNPGFIHSPNPTRLTLLGNGLSDDPFEAGLQHNKAVGLLGIELHTRRRNRMNGKVVTEQSDGLHIDVEQSFGNCPQYIQVRNLHWQTTPTEPITELPALDDHAIAQIQQADTFFVASYADRTTNNARQVDVSHRGGEKGFVVIENNRSLLIPDYSGNRFFATLGNILLNGKAGISFFDFETGDILQLSGNAEVFYDQHLSKQTAGAERFWRFTPDQIFRRRNALPLRTKTGNTASP